MEFIIELIIVGFIKTFEGVFRVIAVSLGATFIPIFGFYQTIRYEPYDIPREFLKKMGYRSISSSYDKRPMITIVWLLVSFVPVGILYLIALIAQAFQKTDNCIEGNHVLRQIQLNDTNIVSYTINNIMSYTVPLDYHDTYDKNLPDILKNIAPTNTLVESRALAIKTLTDERDAENNTVLTVAAASGNFELLNQFLESFEHIHSLQQNINSLQQNYKFLD